MNALLEMNFFQPTPENIAIGLQVVLIGVVSVFTILSLIWGVLTIFGLFFNKKPKNTKEIAPVPAPVKAESAPDESEIVAVLAAAIAMAESESSGVKFRVVSFNRK